MTEVEVFFLVSLVLHVSVCAWSAYLHYHMERLIKQINSNSNETATEFMHISKNNAEAFTQIANLQDSLANVIENENNKNRLKLWQNSNKLSAKMIKEYTALVKKNG